MDDHTAALLERIVTTAFVGTWIILAVLGFLVFRRMSAAGKRRWMPRFAVLAGILFVLFSTTLTVLQDPSWSSLRVLIFVIPAVVLIIYLNIKFTKFCDKCGATLYNYNWFDPMRFCSKCGAELDSIPSKKEGNLLK